MFRKAIRQVTVGILLLSLAASTSPALAHSGLGNAVLRVKEVPRNFSSANTRTYTAYVPFLKVKVQGPFGKYDDDCSPPSIIAGKYRLALIQSFSSTSNPVSTMRLCSFLYKSAGVADKAYRELVRSAVFNATSFSAHKVTSRVGNASVAYSGKTSEEVVFRSDNVALELWYTSLKGVQMSPSAFLHLGALLVSRLR